MMLVLQARFYFVGMESHKLTGVSDEYGALWERLSTEPPGYAGAGVTTEKVKCGEAVTQGQPGYRKADGMYYVDDADVADNNAGIFMLPAAANGYSELAKAGPVDIGATLTVGEQYAVSATKGAIAPLSDITTGEYPKILGTATATDTLEIKILNSGVARP